MYLQKKCYLCTAKPFICNMKHTLFILLCSAVLLGAASCKEEKNEASELLQEVKADFEAGRYDKALAGIDTLRAKYPKAIAERDSALRIYQETSLRQAQQHLATVDSTLQVIEKVYSTMSVVIETKRKAGIATQQELQEFNELRYRRDSLKGVFDVECAKIKYIHKRQKESPTLTAQTPM